MAKKKVDEGVDVAIGEGVNEGVREVPSGTEGSTKKELRVKCRDEKFKPLAKTPGAAGLDLVLAHDLVIRQDEVAKVGTGVHAEIPEGHVGLVFMRSSISDVALTNGVGVIDSDYRGEIMLKLRGTTRIARYAAGDRIAQLVILPFIALEPTLVDELSDTERGEGGFGSTGR